MINFAAGAFCARRKQYLKTHCLNIIEQYTYFLWIAFTERLSLWLQQKACVL